MFKKIILAASAISMLATPALARRDRGYDHGRDGRYYERAYGDRYDNRYCRKDSNIEGTIIGGAGGAVAGRAIAGRGDKAVGTILGAALGGLLGRSIDKNEYRCR